MADLDYIQRKAEAARRFEHVVDGRTFQLRRPTRLETSIALAQSAPGGKRDSASGVRFNRAVVEVAVVGWSGVRTRDVLPGHPQDEPFEFEPGAAAVLFDAQPQWEDQLLDALLRQTAAASATQDAAEKN